MWSFVIFFITLLPLSSLGLDKVDIIFSLNYFSHRNVKLICLLTCEDSLWLGNFAKAAAENSIRVSANNVGNHTYDTTKLKDCLQQTYYSVGVLVDSACHNFAESMVYASLNTQLGSAYRWLIMNNFKINSMDNNTAFDIDANISEIVGSLNISVDADIMQAVKQKNQQYNLHELYNFGKIQGGNLIATKAATWSIESGFSNNLDGYKYYRRWNFQQWQMKMISVVSRARKDFDPKILFDIKPLKGVATLTKTSAIILNVISDVHNFRFVHSIADRWISDYTLNKSEAVVASSLYYKQQDISPAIRFMKDVHDKIDLIHPPLTSVETRYYYRIPTYGAGKFENQFLRPLSNGAWASVVVVSALCALVLLLTAKLERRPSSSQYAIFSVIASICQQFFEDNTVGIRKVSAARKLTVLVTGISCVLTYNYYTSSVVSWLLSGPPPSINSLRELLESPLELIFEDAGYTRSWLQTPTYYYNRRNAEIEDELRKKKVFNKKKDAPLLVPLERGIRMVKAGGFAYHTEVDSANRLISRSFTQSELCELGSLQSIEMTPLYACVQKNSPYKEFFVWSIMRLSERGVVKCIQHRTAFPTARCEGSSPRALALGGAAPAFLLLAAGYLLATAIMVAERFIWKHNRKPKLFVRRKKMLGSFAVLE